MAVKFLDNLDLAGNQLLNVRLQNLATGPAGASTGEIIYNSTANKVQYWNGASWISVPDGTGIGGSGTVGTIPVFNSATEITDSPITISGTRADFSGGIRLSAGNIDTAQTSGSFLAINQGLADKDGNLGTSGQLLSSTGTQVDWIDAPVSYTKWVTVGAAASTQDVNDGDTYSLVESTVGPGIFADPVTKSGTTITQPLSLFLKNLTVAAPSAYSTDVLLWGTNTSPWKAQQTHIDDIPVSAWGQAGATVDMGDNFIIKVLDPVNAQDAATKAYVDANAGTTYTLPVTSGTNAADIKLTDNGGTVASTVNISGTTNETTVGNLASGNITIGLPNNVTLTGDLTVSGGDITLGGTGRIQGIDTVTSGTDAVNKTYVDNAIVGNLVFQGGYNAATNTPDLDSSPSSSIKKGWAYVVTAAGNFFTEAVEVGDFLFAQSDAPTTLADWVTVQNNVGLATASTVGIGNVANSTGTNNEGLSLSYSNGTATVGFNIKNNLSAASGLADDDQIAIFQGSQALQGNFSLTAQLIPPYVSSKNSFAGNNASSGTSHTFTHNLGTGDVTVQLYDTSTKETIYATVDRTGINTVVVTTASSIASGAIRALITKVG